MPRRLLPLLVKQIQRLTPCLPAALAMLLGGAAVCEGQNGISASVPSLISMPAGSPGVLKALQAAVESGDETVAGQALAMDVHPAELSSLLTLAAEQNRPGIVQLLIAYGADASRAPGTLRGAVDRKNAAIVQALLDAGADPNLPDSKGITPLRAALAAGQLELGRIMLRYGGYPDDLLEPALQAGDAALLAALFECGLSPNRTDAGGENILVRAAAESRAEVVRFLIEKGADSTRPGLQGQPALHVAVVKKDVPVIRALLEAGADPNLPFQSPVKEQFLTQVEVESFQGWLKRDAGLTPLMLCAARGDVETMKLLMEKGAKRGLQSKKWKRYPVVFACERGHIPAAQLLLGRKLEEGETPHRVVISLSKQKAMLYKGDELVRTSRVSTGRKGYATPSGSYVITDKQRDWVSTIYKVSMPYFMRLNCLDFGMHAGVCPGYPASHGCIRMPHADVKALFAVLKIGDRVTIED